MEVEEILQILAWELLSLVISSATEIRRQICSTLGSRAVIMVEQITAASKNHSKRSNPVHVPLLE
jgi:hypothetical protein